MVVGERFNRLDKRIDIAGLDDKSAFCFPYYLGHLALRRMRPA